MSKAMRYSTALEVEKAVRNLYMKNGYIVLSQVRNGTGYERKARTADMMIVSTWPSRGLHCEGVEIKVSRSDLKSELADPKKADDLAKYCKWWWLAVPDDLITPDMLIPENWGIITVNDKGVAKVDRRGAVLEPVPMDALMVCSLLRNFSETHVHESDVEGKVKARVDKAVEDARANTSYHLRELEDGYEKFREATGISLLERNHPIWNMASVGEAVNLLMALRARPADALQQAADALRGASAAVDATLTVLSGREEAPHV